jgi:hypothetical protein
VDDTSPGPRFSIDSDAAELEIVVDRQLSPFGWEYVIANVDRYVRLVDIVILEGSGWSSPAGRRAELLLRDRLPAQGVPVLHADDPLVDRWRSVGPQRRREATGRKHRGPNAW